MHPPRRLRRPVTKRRSSARRLTSPRKSSRPRPTRSLLSNPLPTSTTKPLVVVITAPRHLRAERRPVADSREERMLPEEEKVQAADYAYVNDGTLEELDAFVADVMARLTA